MSCDTLFMHKIQNRQIHRDRKETSIFQGLGEREYTAIAYRVPGFFFGSVLKFIVVRVVQQMF